jgi:hypothetical protein
MTRTLPAALAMGMAQHTTLGVERPFVDMVVRGRGKRGREVVGIEREKNRRGRRMSRGSLR